MAEQALHRLLQLFAKPWRVCTAAAFQLTEPLYLDFRWDSLHAKIPTETMDSVANGAIQYEHTCVSGIFTALGVPGGVALVGTIPADIIQYYGYMLRAAQ